MAIILSNKAVLNIGGSRVSELTGVTLTHTKNYLTVRALDDDVQNHLETTEEFSLSIEAMVSSGDAGAAQLIDGATVSFQLLPGGSTSGEYSYSGSGIVTSVNRTMALDNTEAITATIINSGSLTVGTV